MIFAERYKRKGLEPGLVLSFTCLNKGLQREIGTFWKNVEKLMAILRAESLKETLLRIISRTLIMCPRQKKNFCRRWRNEERRQF